MLCLRRARSLRWRSRRACADSREGPRCGASGRGEDGTGAGTSGRGEDGTGAGTSGRGEDGTGAGTSGRDEDGTEDDVCDCGEAGKSVKFQL